MTVTNTRLTTAAGGTIHLISAATDDADQAAAMQAALDDILAQSGKREYAPPFDRFHGPKDAWKLPEWTESDLDALSWALADLDDNQRAIIRHLAAAEGQWMSTTSLLKAAGYPAEKSASGVFRAIAGRFRRCDRRPLWDGRRGNGDGRELTIHRDGVADLVRRALG
jgi:hypothetical protein